MFNRNTPLTMKMLLRSLIVLPFLLVALQSVKAQDTLLMKNGNQVIAKILEVNTAEIKYKRFDNLEGPTFVIVKNDVVMIKYQNGTVDKIADQVVSPTTTHVDAPIVIQKAPVVVDPKIYPSGNGYYADNRRIGQAELYNKLLNLNDSEITKHVHQAKAARGLQFVGFVAIPCMVGGVISVITQSFQERNNSRYSADYTTGAGLLSGGVVCLVGSTVFKISCKKHVKKAIDLYNAKF